ncbi:hypothetical protein N8I77_008043 [Diaporthe amygdali]|uniref:N-acetyltransferase domain-containing protein n=1 Tax=Phomopsis amygdali TaxID=1214568 RepID=A0AAD9SEJ6_PHOAM|nr:hypothetical protein N8I77_008043 [Diaporthe amygdali]
MVDTGSHAWGPPNAHQRAQAINSIDESTKLFQKYLDNTAPKSQKTSKSTHPHVQGGLPPHLLKQQESTGEHTPDRTPRTTGPNTPPSALASDSQPHERTWSSQNIAASQMASQVASQVTPAPSVQLPTWEQDLRDRHMVVFDRNVPSSSAGHYEPPSTVANVSSSSAGHREPLSSVASEQAISPPPTHQDSAQHAPFRRSLKYMHPALQKVVSQKMNLDAKRRSRVESPRDAWLAINPTAQDGRRAQAEKTTQQKYQTDHRDPKINKKMWQPSNPSNHDSHSLPSSSMSVKFDSSDNTDSLKPVLKDVRGSIADEMDIVIKGDGTGWVNKHAWKDYHSIPESDDDGSEDSFKKGWMPQYCSDWVESLRVTPPPLASFLDPEVETHWECDIDPQTGALVSPVDYPQTTVNSQDSSTPEELARRMSGTAEVKVIMEAEKLRKRMAHREKMEAKRSERHLDGKYKRVAIPPTQQDPPSDLGHSSLGTEQLPDQTTTAFGEPQRQDQREPRILCFLRPVERDDLPQILDIYNWEVEHGHQALDAQPLTLRDIQRMFSDCEATGTPFIVAVKGVAPKNSTSRRKESKPVRTRGPYKQSGQTSPHVDGTAAPLNQPSSVKILGFGLITLLTPGLAGHFHTSVGRFNGKVHFFVEHSSRRLGIGRCILHRLLRCCSKFMHNVDWYKWYNLNGSKACADAGYNMRDYARVFVEMASFKGDPDFNWCKGLLQEMNFLYVNTTDLTRKVNYGMKGGWFDNTVWQHDCSGPGDIREYN